MNKDQIIEIGTWVFWGYSKVFCRVIGHEFYDEEQTLLYTYTLELDEPLEYTKDHIIKEVWAYPTEVRLPTREDKLVYVHR